MSQLEGVKFQSTPIPQEKLEILSPVNKTSIDNKFIIEGTCHSGIDVAIFGDLIGNSVVIACVNGKFSKRLSVTPNNGDKKIIVQQLSSNGLAYVAEASFAKDTSVIEVMRFSKAKEVLNNHCLVCHQSNSSKPMHYNTEQEFIDRGYITKGDSDRSSMVYRLIHYNGPTSNVARNMPKAPLDKNFTLEDYQVLYDWVDLMRADEVEEENLVFNCTDESSSSKTPNYFLTKKQYVNTLKDLFGDKIIELVELEISLLENEIYNKDSHRKESIVSSNSINVYFDIATKIVEYFKNNKNEFSSLVGTCVAQSSVSDSCLDQYLNNLAKNIFRRPLTSNEISSSKTLVSEIDDNLEKILNMFKYHLISPNFLWRVEVGESSFEGDSSKIPLTQYEIASRISYFTMDSMPDALLMQDAKDNKLRDKAIVSAHVKRLLNTQNGKNKVIDNISRWSLTDKVNGFSAVPDTLKEGINMDLLGDAMVNEARKFIEYIVYEKQGSFKELVTSKDSFASHTGLASIYGHEPYNGTIPKIMAGKRQGILLRAPFLTWPSTRTSIIHRGVDFQKRVLCNDIPDPDVDISDQRDDVVLSNNELFQMSNREIIRQKTQSPLCMSCHSVINPTGYAFEMFGPLGNIRKDELVFDANEIVNSILIDSSSTIPLPGLKSVSVEDAFDLATFISSSEEGTSCFSKNTFRFIFEKKEDVVKDACTLSKGLEKVKESSGSILDAFVNIIANDSLFYKVND